MRPGYANGKPSVIVLIWRQPNANIIDTVDHIRAMLPYLRAAIPRSIDTEVGKDGKVTIRASVHDVEETLVISALLFGVGAVAVILKEAFRFAWAHEARHEIVRRYRTRR
ncbi:MAG: efflux RND transporter permease subunit [Terriglobia bacterium]